MNELRIDKVENFNNLVEKLNSRKIELMPELLSEALIELYQRSTWTLEALLHASSRIETENKILILSIRRKGTSSNLSNWSVEYIEKGERKSLNYSLINQGI